MPKQYTVKNNQTGQTITFAWHDDVNPPTEADIDQVFAAAAPQDSPYGEVFPDYGGAAKEIGQTIKDNPGTTGAILGGLAAAPFTGGMSVPAMMALEGAAAGAGHLAGEALSAATTERPVPDNLFKEAGKEAAFSALTAGVGPAARAIGRGLYHTALRPTLTLSHTPDEIAKLIDTGIEEGISVSGRGYRKATNLIEGLDADVRKLIEDLNTVEDAQRGFDKITALRQKYLRRGAPQAKIDALDALEANYRARYSAPMRGEQMHELKQGIWKETGPSFERELNTGTTEAMREFGSGLRETLEEAGKRRGVTDIGEKNARMGSLIDLKEQIERSASHYPGVPGLRQAAEVATGTSSGGIVSRAIATSAPVLSTAGRGLAKVGAALDPRSFRPASAHPPIGGKPKQTPVTLDTVGVEEVPGARWEPDPLDRVGVPTERGARDIDQAWQEKFAPEPVISHNPPPVPPKSLDQLGIPENSGPAYQRDPLDALDMAPASPGRSEEELWLQRVTPEPTITHTPGTRSPLDRGQSFAKKTELDELGIPAAEGPREGPVSLDALDIPSARDVYSSDELWIKKILSDADPRLNRLGYREWKRLIKEAIESGAYRSAVERNPNARITKDKVKELYSRYLAAQ